MDSELKIHIVHLMTLDEEKLLIEFGKELKGDSLFSISDKELLKLAKNWLSRQRNDIAENICANSKISSLYREMNDKSTKIQLVTAVADLISPFVIGISPWTVSVLLVKEGLDTLCKEHWT